MAIRLEAAYRPPDQNDRLPRSMAASTNVADILGASAKDGNGSIVDISLSTGWTPSSPTIAFNMRLDNLLSKAILFQQQLRCIGIGNGD